MTGNSGSLLSRRLFAAVAAVALLAPAVPQHALAAENSTDQPLQIWFIRHAQSEINVATVPHPVADYGITYPLTRDGVEQASGLAEALASTPITTIYTSTLLRAIQTADALAFKHGLALSLAPEAVEINLGIGVDAPDGRQIYRDLANKWVIEKDIAARVGDGESFADAQRRFLPFVRELMNRHATDTGVVVVISHGATLGLLVPMLAPNVPADYALRHSLSNTSIIKTELRDGKLFCTEWAGISNADFGG